jgi:outer membrane lipoprotein-sorting protein
VTKFTRSRANPASYDLLVFLLLALGICLGSFLAAVAPAAAAEKPPPEQSHSWPKPTEEAGLQATSLARTDFEVAIVQYWSLGPLLRAEAVIGGHNIVTVVNGDFYYAYDALTSTGYRIRRTPEAIAADSSRERPFGLQFQEILDQGGEKVREESFEGVSADVYRVTDEHGRRTLWVRQDSSRVPIRLETYDRTRARTGRLDWINWLEGVKLSKSFFVPPSEVKLEEFDSYEEYLLRLVEGPVPPARPFFHDLLGGRLR